VYVSGSWRRWLFVSLGVGLATLASAETGDLRVEIQQPPDGTLLPSLESRIEVEGGASIFGGVRYLDLFLVIDTSKSLERTDKRDYRVRGAVGLVKSLPAKSDIQLGVVAFDNDADLLAPLTSDRGVVIEALKDLDRFGSTDIAAGIETALAGFAAGARPGSSRVILLFTDGRSDEAEARDAAREAKRRGVALHTLMLGSDEGAARMLGQLAHSTGGSFLRVRDPRKLPEAFVNLKTTGVESVTLSVNGSAPVPAKLSGGRFRADLPLVLGENRIVATATSLEGESRQAISTVTVSDDVHVRIDTPAGGTLFEDRRQQALVTGRASLFERETPEIAAAYPDRGIRRVVLRVDQSPPFATQLVEGRFEGRVMLHEGENRILATATAADGRIADAAIRVTVRPPGCGELEVKALRDGQPALSLSDRSVELVFDASNSMWGRMQGEPKMSVAKNILSDALGWLPEDLTVALRVYGHQHPREQRDCRDSELLVPMRPGNREQIRGAIESFRPRGQTPLAYSLEQVVDDLRGVRGERAVVLVTDGLESCGGDPVAAARALQAGGPIPVHVIGFGLGEPGDEDPTSLRAIAAVSGGKYVTARSAEELRSALSASVGTAFQVMQGGRLVADGSLGADDVMLLPAGDYEVRVASEPPYSAPVQLASEENLTLLLERNRGGVLHSGERGPASYQACQDTPLQAPATDPLLSPAAPATRLR
jgi:Mg-chelatase subunit ChlD